MEPAAGGRANVLGDIGREGDDVMIESAFQFLTALDSESSPGLHSNQVLLRHNACRAKGFAGEKFDLQPELQLALFAPDFPHGRARVALNHGLRIETVSPDVEER